MESDGRDQTIGLLEELRELCQRISRDFAVAEIDLLKLVASISNPNLPDVDRDLSYRLEKWDRQDRQVTWLVALTSTVTIANAAFDEAVRTYPNERWTLRQSARVLRSHEPLQNVP